MTLTRFEEANRLGREVKRPDGSAQPLRIIPGVVRDRHAVSLTALHDDPAIDRVPDLAPGVVTDEAVRASLAEPSYLVLHYPSKDDPARQPDDADRMNANHPSPDLGDRNWKVVESGRAGDGWTAVFETDLPAPYFLRLRKTYTLGPKDYHVALKLDMAALPGRAKDKGEFRYQVVGAHGLPIEGEWYTTAYRNVMAGWTTPNGGAVRSFDDARTIAVQHGGDRIARGPNAFNYAAVTTQYFASALAVDDETPKGAREMLWDAVRPTREPGPGDRTDQQPFLTDVTFRAVAAPVRVPAGETVSHRYLIYDGPLKVASLGQLRDAAPGGEKPGREMAVAPELVERYCDKLGLRTLTDYQSPSVFGRISHFLWWSDLIIFFTNVMHWVLGMLHGIVPVWGLNVVMLTVLVRLMLFYPSRKQQTAMARMQEKMAKLKPEIDKLQEKYKDDYYALQQAKSELMRRNGANPVSTMGGCALLFAQMPVLMGLYFCLQESVFFRLDPFLGWINNLAAPDMLAWWSENIPYVSTPDSIGSMFYLGPYLNILPIVAVTLIFLQQKMTLPPPTDEQMEMQQKTMKMMVLFMAVFFYKVPAGLCIYFICGTLWALAERKLIPKPKAVEPTLVPVGPLTGGGGKAATGPAVPPAGPPGFMGRMKAKIDEIQRQAEQQSERQIRNGPPGSDRNDRRDKKKKRK